MLLDLRKIIYVPGESVEFDCELDIQRLDFPSVSTYPVPPHAHGRVFNEAGILRLIGEVEAEMVCFCDRCGREFESTKITEVDAVLTAEEQDDNVDLFPLDGDAVDLDEVLSTCFILDMEQKVLCRDDCRGLCPSCGKNLNDGPCGCTEPGDPRLAVLGSLLETSDD